MLKFLQRLFSPFVNIQPQERQKTFLMFCYFFLIIALIYILKPVRSSLFLNELGAQNLRFVYMGEGLFLVLVVAVYVYLSKRIRKDIFSVLVLLFFISNLFVFWFLFHRKTPYLSAFFYVWVASFSITMTTQFWILANDIFNPAEAKRLFGVIISGGSLGGVIGGFSTQAVVYWLKTEDLLLAVAALLFVCAILNFFIWRTIPIRDWIGSEPSTGKAEKAGTSKKTPLQPDSQSAELMNPSRAQILRRSSYLIMLALIVMSAKLASTIIDNQFNASVELAITGKEDRTAFLGGFMACLNAVSLMSQLFLTSFFLRYLGIGFSLQVLPFGLTLFSIFSAFSPALLPSLLLKTFDGSVNYSIQQASKEVLFLPLSSSLRHRVKPLIDMLGFRGAKTLGGVYIAIAAPLLGLSDDKLGILVLSLMPLWFFLAWRMRHDYSNLLRHHLLGRWPYTPRVVKGQRATDVLGYLYDEKNWHQIQLLINHPSSYTRKIAATACLAYARSQNLASARKLVERMIREEAFQVHQSLNSLDDQLTHDDYWFFIHRVLLNSHPEALQRMEWKSYLQGGPQEILTQLEKILKNPKDGLDAKRRAVRLLGFILKQEAVELLLNLSAESQDHAFRFIVAKALDQMHEKNPKLEMSRSSIKSEIAREVKIYKTFQKLIYFYDHYETKTENPKYLRAALKTILDESLERLFHYLDLLYPLEIMHNIHAWIVGHPESDPVRHQAIELFSNAVEPDVLLLLGNILEPKSSQTEEEEAVKILEELISFEDRWFSLVGIFLVSELQLDAKWPQLAKIKNEPRFQEFLGSS